MRLDKFTNPIFNETDVFNVLYQGNTSVLSDCEGGKKKEIFFQSLGAE